ncbi:Hypothetical protein PHPALM_5185, partial [Phytophthora palmivora]
MSESISRSKTKKKTKEVVDEEDAKSRSRRADSDAMRSSVSSSLSDESSVMSSPSQRHQRPRFDSKASWADSTRFDMGRADSRASEMSARDLRLTGLASHSILHIRPSGVDLTSRRSRTSGRSSMSGSVRGRQSSFVSNFGVTKGKKRKDSNALSTITENWNLADDQFGSPFS